MSTKAPKMDVGSLLFLLISLAGILFVVYFLVTSLINTYKRNSIKGEASSTHLVEAAADNLKPIGVAATGDAVAAAAPAATRSGEDVYGTVCSVCHKTGVADAPKFADKAAWEPRVATGLDALMATAVNGKGAMPPRAGQNVGDEELKAAILYMVKGAGLDLGGASSSEAAPEKKAEPAPEKTEEPAAEPEKAAEAPAAPKEPESPKEPSMETAAAAVATTAAAAVATTAEAPAAKAAAPSGDGAALYTAKGCGACHGANAMTPIMPLYPKIAGQGKVYVTTQMADIKSGKRNNGQTAAMKGIMASVSEAEIDAIAEYISGL